MKVAVIRECDQGASIARPSTRNYRVLRMQQIGHVADEQCRAGDGIVAIAGRRWWCVHDGTARIALCRKDVGQRMMRMMQHALLVVLMLIG